MNEAEGHDSDGSGKDIAILPDCKMLPLESPERREVDLHLRAFVAVKDRRTCARYVAGHQGKLASHGIDNLDSADEKWTNNPSVLVVVAEDAESREMFGGFRLHIANDVYSLPIEDALCKLDSRVHDRIHRQFPGSSAEIAGLWTSSTQHGSVAKYLVPLLARSVFAIAHRLGVKWTWGIAPHHTLRVWRRFGALVDTYLGADGTFHYPDTRFLSWVLRLDTQSFETTPLAERARILDLANHPRGLWLEELKQIRPKVEYDLSVLSASGGLTDR
jgi:hypothetical protein